MQKRSNTIVWFILDLLLRVAVHKYPEPNFAILFKTATSRKWKFNQWQFGKFCRVVLHRLNSNVRLCGSVDINRAHSRAWSIVGICRFLAIHTHTTKCSQVLVRGTRLSALSTSTSINFHLPLLVYLTQKVHSPWGTCSLQPRLVNTKIEKTSLW